jgi:hypothetical protein
MFLAWLTTRTYHKNLVIWILGFENLGLFWAIFFPMKKEVEIIFFRSKFGEILIAC